jgi:predicted nucleotidyltransferase
MHFTKKKLHNHISSFLSELKTVGYSIDKVILFGSYAHGKPHENSDIDLAVWSSSFLEDPYTSRDAIRKILTCYHPIQLQPFPSGETAETNPFIEIIESTGIDITSGYY